MYGIPNGNNCSIEKPFPGCLGRMVNLFDLSMGVNGNRLLTDKPHHEGSYLSRSQSDVARVNPSSDEMDDKLIASELMRTSSNQKSGGTPMKMLIAQEMSKEIDPKRNPPSVVAKLMGLDEIPQQQLDPATRRSKSGSYSRGYHDTRFSYWQERQKASDGQLDDGLHFPGQNNLKDVHAVWQQRSKTNNSKEKSPRKGKFEDSANDKKMALIRQKFDELKRLSTDKNLLESKQYRDTLEVLSSHGDLILKAFQEPHTMFPQHLYSLQSVPPPETKRITVLRPSKMVDSSKIVGFGKDDNRGDKPIQVGHAYRMDRSPVAFSSPAASWNIDESPAHPTRIVVLKPSCKPQTVRALGSPPSASPRTLDTECFFEEPENNETQEFQEAAKVTPKHVSGNLSSHRRDETLLSSVFSNGYIGDESSFHKSENEYTAGNLSDSEAMSPVSRHSWDYIHRFGSPYSCSSISRASYSPESSVCREAKKRLSERWAMMASTGTHQEPRHIRRSSSTLGEMLALSDTKLAETSLEGKTEEKTMDVNSDVIRDPAINGNMDNTPRNLIRSKSVPVSSNEFGNTFHIAPNTPEGKQAEIPKEITKPRSTKSSFKGKVSSLFFSKSKKPAKDKPCSTQPEDVSRYGEMPSQCSEKSDVVDSKCIGDIRLECSSIDSKVLFVQPASCISSSMGKEAATSCEDGLSAAKTFGSGNMIENQDQPSPISVLEPPFVEDEHVAALSSSNGKLLSPGLAGSPKCNLIDKSPPIGSIARTLSWDDSCVDTTSSIAVKPSSSTRGAAEEEGEWLVFIQTLLSVAGLDGHINSDSFLSKWHSPGSPLDPSLREKYIDVNEKETLHEARRRQRRSTRKLVFDCVNAALMEIAGYGSDTCQRAISCSGVHSNLSEGDSFIMVDEVWARMKQWFSSGARYAWADGGDSNSLVVEKVVRNEVVGKGWLDNLRLEVDNLGKDIEGRLLEELVHEAVVELTGRR